MLVDFVSKIFRFVFNLCCLGILGAHGKNQKQIDGTPKIGCSDGLFTIKTLLNTQNNHNLPTFVAFVDLVKAFNTSGHEL